MSAETTQLPLDYMNDPHLSVSVRNFLRPINILKPPLENLSKEEARQFMGDLQASVPVDLSGIDESEMTIDYEGCKVSLNIARPEGVEKDLPAFLFIHGGGWTLGNYSIHRRMIRDLVVLSGFVCVFINYSPSPEAKYPRALQEIHAAAKWVVENSAVLGIDGTRMAIVGNGSGANMAVGAVLMAKANGGPDFRLQVLMWPVTNAAFDTESWNRYGRQRFLTAELMKRLWDEYTTDADQRKEIYASPLQARPSQLAGLPPTLIQVAENDIVRDEGEAFGRLLDAAGVSVTTLRYNGVIHGFGLFNGLAAIPQTRSLFLHAAAELKRHLG